MRHLLDRSHLSFVAVNPIGKRRGVLSVHRYRSVKLSYTITNYVGMVELMLDSGALMQDAYGLALLLTLGRTVCSRGKARSSQHENGTLFLTRVQV